MPYTIASMGGRNYLEEQAYSDALSLIAMGETREETRGYLFDNFPELSQDEISATLADALEDALHYVHREDIDPSFFE